MFKRQYLQVFDLKLNKGSFHALEAVGRGSETQLQVRENLNYLIFALKAMMDDCGDNIADGGPTIKQHCGFLAFSGPCHLLNMWIATAIPTSRWIKMYDFKKYSSVNNNSNERSQRLYCDGLFCFSFNDFHSKYAKCMHKYDGEVSCQKQ